MSSPPRDLLVPNDKVYEVPDLTVPRPTVITRSLLQSSDWPISTPEQVPLLRVALSSVHSQVVETTDEELATLEELGLVEEELGLLEEELATLEELGLLEEELATLEELGLLDEELATEEDEPPPGVSSIMLGYIPPMNRPYNNRMAPL